MLVATANVVALPRLTVDVWSAAEEYFAISGTTPNDLMASAAALVPAHCLEYSGRAIACVGPRSAVDPSVLRRPSDGRVHIYGGHHHRDVCGDTAAMDGAIISACGVARMVEGRP